MGAVLVDQALPGSGAVNAGGQGSDLQEPAQEAGPGISLHPRNLSYNGITQLFIREIPDSGGFGLDLEQQTLVILGQLRDHFCTTPEFRRQFFAEERSRSRCSILSSQTRPELLRAQAHQCERISSRSVKPMAATRNGGRLQAAPRFRSHARC